MEKNSTRAEERKKKENTTPALISVHAHQKQKGK